MYKPFACLPGNGQTFTCWDCGHTWNRGTDGSHSCVEVLQERLARSWIIAHCGDPCVLCGVAHDAVAPGGCSATPHQLWSVIGDLGDRATALEEEGGREVEARALVELKRQLERLFSLLGTTLIPALPPSFSKEGRGRTTATLPGGQTVRICPRARRD